MNRPDTSGPAFPVKAENTSKEVKLGLLGEGVNPGDWATYPGISRREYFAAAALQGILARNDPSGWSVEAGRAARAVLYADELIAELDK